MFNALTRIEEDEAGDAGPLAGAAKGLEEKGVRVSFFEATLGISPYLFMREVGHCPGGFFEWDKEASISVHGACREATSMSETCRGV